MAGKGRRSRSAGAAAGCGPFGFFLALGAIGVLIQYWWVLLIVLGVVGLTVAIVRFARTPPRLPKPRPVITPRIPALASEDLAVQMRATKQVRHLRDMQEWDYEWIRLTHPEKSGRELRETANAHFARGRADTDHTAQAEPGEDFLTSDPRTMWAWADYLDGRLSLPVSDEAARQVLAAIPPGDHVEIFGAVAVSEGYPRQSKYALPREARFAARTFDRWILPSLGDEAEIIPASSTRHYSTGWGQSLYMAESSFSLADGRHMEAYADRIRIDRYDEGAGLSILRLPDNPFAPAPPGLGTGGEDALVADYIESVTDRVRKAQANYGANDAWLALHETYGEDKNRLSRAENYLKGAVDDIKRHPRIGAETHKALVSHFRNADLKAAFFCIALGLPYPGDKPLSRAHKRPPKPADFY